MFQCYDLCGTCLRTLATFQTVGIEKAYFLSSAVVGRELHRADTGTHLALHLTGAADVEQVPVPCSMRNTMKPALLQILVFC